MNYLYLYVFFATKNILKCPELTTVFTLCNCSCTFWPLTNVWRPYEFESVCPRLFKMEQNYWDEVGGGGGTMVPTDWTCKCKLYINVLQKQPKICLREEVTKQDKVKSVQRKVCTLVTSLASFTSSWLSLISGVSIIVQKRRTHT